MASSFIVKNILLTETDIKRVFTRIAHEIIEKNRGIEGIALVGIQTRGVPIANEIAGIIESIEKKKPYVGSLDIAFYRDDLSTRPSPVLKGTKIDFDINGKTVILIDDVLYTGRTIRAALDALMDIGRPRQIQLAVLVDRGHRELPIRPDYVGKNVPTSKDEEVKVYIKQIDKRSEVVIGEQVEGR